MQIYLSILREVSLFSPLINPCTNFCSIITEFIFVKIIIHIIVSSFVDKTKYYIHVNTLLFFTWQYVLGITPLLIHSKMVDVNPSIM